ncbi:hypothetical protein D9M72_394090 [compost metagenome]
MPADPPLFLRRRGHAARRLRSGVPRPAAEDPDQRLWPHRSGGDAHALEGGRARALRAGLCTHRPPGRRTQRARARCRDEPGAARRARRAVPRRRRSCARLPAPCRPDGRALRGRPLRRTGPASLPHRRPRAMERGRPARVPRPHRSPGEGAGLSHRTRRDRGAAAAAARRAPGRGGGRRRTRRRAARGLRRRGPDTRRVASQAGAGRGAARLHGARHPRRAGEAAAQCQRQDRPQGAARTRGSGCRCALRGAAGRGRGRARAKLGRGAGHGARGPPGQLLRTRRRFDPEPADRGAHAQGRLAHHAAAALRAPDGGVAGHGGASGADRNAASREPARGRGAAVAHPGRLPGREAARAEPLEPGGAAAAAHAGGTGGAAHRMGGGGRAPRRLQAALRSRCRGQLDAALRRERAPPGP